MPESPIKAMKRIRKNLEKFGPIDLFDTLSRKHGLRLGDASSQERLLDSVSKLFRESTDNPIVLHGRRVQAMFGYVVASLGKSVAIKEEDAGELFAAINPIQIPDYRIVLEPGNEFLVEVKNFHQKKLNSKLKFTAGYTGALHNYGQVFARPVKLAIYWSRWNRWTLVSLDKLSPDGGKRSISFLEAVTINEMATLGDINIGTKPPLILKVLTDSSKPRTVQENGQVGFTIGGIELYSAETRIDDEYERNLAFYFMLYGDWPASEPEARIEDGQLISLDFVAAPIESTPGQGFEFIGDLSGMISRRYNDLTTSEGHIDRLSPSNEPSSLGILIPPDYKGKFLPLWRFHLKPNDDR